MSAIEKGLAFIETTTLHALEGEQFGMTREEVAVLMLSFSVGLYCTVAGRAATVNVLRGQADVLERDNG